MPTGITPKQPQKKLQVSELRYRRLFEAAQDGILILDAHSGKIVDANPFLKRLLGFSEKELLGKELWQVGVFKDIVDSKIAFHDLQNKGYIRYDDLPLQTKKGKSIQVEFVSNVYIVDSQKVIQCNIRDITDRKKLEKLAESRANELEQLTKSQEITKKAMLNVMEDLEATTALMEVEKVKDEAMLASIGEGMIAVDNEGRVMIMNKVAEDMLGRKLKELKGKVIMNLILEDEAGNVLPRDKRPTTIALATGEVTKVVHYFVRKNKSRFPIAITATPIKITGKTIGLIEIIRDVTKEVEIDKAKSEFVSLASHQLRTPLGIARWYLEAIKGAKEYKHFSLTLKKYFNEVYSNNERVLALVRDLLSVSRIDQGKVKDIPQPTEVLELLNSVVKEMSIVAAKRRISIELLTGKLTLPRILIDPVRLREVIENLITNALQYNRSPGKVSVTANEKPNKTLVIAVSDTGIGIPPADLDNLFLKFFRSERGMVSNTEGSGLGLYVVKSYVEGWGGNIFVKTKEGKGSTFSITLPMIKENTKSLATKGG